MEEEVQDQIKNLDENDLMHTDCNQEVTDNESGKTLLPQNLEAENYEASQLEVGVNDNPVENKELLCQKGNVDGDTESFIQTLTSESSLQTDDLTVEDKEEHCLRYSCA